MNEAKFIISKKKIFEQYDKITKLSDIISYSSKTNPQITKILEEEKDCWFSIHLVEELENLSDKSRILFFSQGWNREMIRDLLSKGIRKFSVDNEPDLTLFLEVIEEENTHVELFLRAKLRENTVKTERYFVFGFSSDFINKNVKTLRENKNISKLGIHFHRKTQNMSEWNLKSDFNGILDSENLQYIDYVNIGGGLPSDYANTNYNVIENIFEKIISFKDFLNGKGINLVIEPGRFIAAPSVKLETEIIRIYDNNIIVNASVYNSDMDALIVPVKLLVEGELDKNDENASSYVIKGLTPCSLDLFRYRVYLKNPREGDKIVFLNSGAYNFSTNFCNLPILKTEILNSF